MQKDMIGMLRRESEENKKRIYAKEANRMEQTKEGENLEKYTWESKQHIFEKEEVTLEDPYGVEGAYTNSKDRVRRYRAPEQELTDSEQSYTRQKEYDRRTESYKDMEKEEYPESYADINIEETPYIRSKSSLFLKQFVVVLFLFVTLLMMHEFNIAVYVTIIDQIKKLIL